MAAGVLSNAGNLLFAYLMDVFFVSRAEFYEEVWFFAVAAAGGVLLLAIVIVMCCICMCYCYKCIKTDGKYYSKYKATNSQKKKKKKKKKKN